jgi:hypothetical protein
MAGVGFLLLLTLFALSAPRIEGHWASAAGLPFVSALRQG